MIILWVRLVPLTLILSGLFGLCMKGGTFFLSSFDNQIWHKGRSPKIYSCPKSGGHSLINDIIMTSFYFLLVILLILHLSTLHYSYIIESFELISSDVLQIQHLVQHISSSKQPCFCETIKLGSSHKVWPTDQGRRSFQKFIKIFKPHQEFAKKFGTPLIFKQIF